MDQEKALELAREWNGCIRGFIESKSLRYKNDFDDVTSLARELRKREDWWANRPLDEINEKLGAARSTSEVLEALGREAVSQGS